MKVLEGMKIVARRLEFDCEVGIESQVEIVNWRLSSSKGNCRSQWNLSSFTWISQLDPLLSPE
jgi:hypothetical protein